MSLNWVRRATVVIIGFWHVANMARGGALPLRDTPFARIVAETPLASAAQDVERGNRVAMLSQGYDALLLRVHLIRSATRSIEIQTFIWTNDEVGRLVIYELIEAARRGVKVRIVADHLFSDQDPDVVAFLATAHPNFEVRHYRPATSRMKPGLWRTMLAGVRAFHDVNQRMHSKVMIVDGAVLITGGRNFENTYFDHSTALNFRDRDVVAVGPIVRTASEQFEQFWSYRFTVTSRDLVDVRAALKQGTFRRFDRREDYDFGGFFMALDAEANDTALVERRFVSQLRAVERARFLYDAPGKSHRGSDKAAATARELNEFVKRAQSSVVLQTPYLVLSGTARDLMLELRRRTPAVDVRIATNSFASTDNLYAYSANYRLRADYVRTLGLTIYEFKPLPAELPTFFPTYPAMLERARQKPRQDAAAKAPFVSLHAKSLVIDDTIGFVGSYNLDPRSERLNTETGLLVVDREFARALRAEIERDMQPENSWVIARRRFPLRLDIVNGLVAGVFSLTPLDLWPIQNTSSFELIPGQSPVAPDDRSFYERYRDVGPFPGAENPLTEKEIVARLLKAFGAPLTPIL